tara:strand:+ start:3447 stop:4727 length:1281 start_codon:yes stop_codon:yes gene_type:complete
MSENLTNKRLLILGGNPETGAVVDYANRMGVHTIVIDPNPTSPAKKNACESYNIDVIDIDKLYSKVKDLELDGVLVGVADILVPSYQKICNMLNFPCYATLNSIETLTTKNGFRNKCEEFKINVIPYYEIDKDFKLEDIKKVTFPLLVKPVDNGAGVGMNISKNSIELKSHIDIALKNSKRKDYLVEKYMDCDDMLVYYTISDGTPYLSAAADRYTTKAQDIGSPVCSLAMYPSKYLNLYKEKVNKKVIKLIRDTGVKNGVLNIQFFVEKNIFYAYDPGFRLQGEAPHLHLNKINKFDNREMLINFSLTSTTNEPNLKNKNDPNFKGKNSSTLWILLKKGVIGKINGLNIIKKYNKVFEVIQRLYLGDEVSNEMIGTERQVFGRFYIISDSLKELKDSIKFVQNNLQVLDINGSDMILEVFDTNKL